jgi:DNA-binding IclR family transcriptional regulator
MGAGSAGDGANTIQCLDRGLRVITELAQAPELGTSAIARLLGLNKSSVYRILSTLRQHGFVVKSPTTGKYALGIRAFEIGAAVANRSGLLEQSSPVMELLAQRFNETVNLAVLDGPDVIYLHKIESSEPLRLGLRVGTRVPAFCSALGKMLLAELPQNALSDWVAAAMSMGRLPSYTPKTISDPSRLRDELGRVHRRGFAVDDEEYKPGVRCVAAPVRGHLGRPIAALSVAGPTFRVTMERIDNEIGPAVQEAAWDISRRMGYGVYTWLGTGVSGEA